MFTMVMFIMMMTIAEVSPLDEGQTPDHCERKGGTPPVE
jgi:hypothetical protein